MKKLLKIIGIVIILTIVVSSLSLICSAAEEEDLPEAPVLGASIGGSIGGGTGTWDGPLKHTSHIWNYSWDGHSINAVCCYYPPDGATSSLSLNSEKLYGTTGQIFSFCSGKEIDTTGFTVSENWDSEYYFTYAPMDDDSASWQLGLPTANGTYKIAVCLPEGTEVEDSTGTYGNFTEFICVSISDHHVLNPRWTKDGVKLVNNCADCGERLAEMSIDPESSFGNACSDMKHVPNFIYWYLDDVTEAEVNNNYPHIGLLFEGKTRALKKSYPLQTPIPNALGDYNVYIAAYEGDEFTVDSVTAKSDPVLYKVKAHYWQYKANGYCLTADCAACDAHAEVCLDTSTAYEASRNFSTKDIEDYDVFYETNWSSQDDIANYSVLFDGKLTNENTLYDRAFVKPTSTGNFTARLAVLEDDNDVDSVIVSTEKKVFYLADISIAECDVISYGNTEIAQFPQPAIKGGFYQVGTKEELLWCLYKANTTACIELTNDIVVNPITVDKNGNVYSANPQIYLWDGFGTASDPFIGAIRGNGHTVYGLYSPNVKNQYSGFIDHGKNCNISGLTIENSVLCGVDAASVIAFCEVKSSGTSKSVKNCRALNCYICGSSTQGGIVSWIKSDKGTELHIEDCGCDSILYGDAIRGTGGIVGKSEGTDKLYIERCFNLGSVTAKGSGSYAGGIIGYANLDSAESVLALWDDFNTGTISATSFEGGIAGYLKDYGGKDLLYFDNCANTGYLSSCMNIGGLAGYMDSTYMYFYRATVLGNYYMNAKVAFRMADSSISLENRAEKISKTQVTNGFICNRYGHTECTHHDMIKSADCTHDGELTLKCAVCGCILEDKVIRAYGHHFTSWGECMNCGLSIEDYEAQLAAGEDALSGSVFGSSPVLVAVSAGGALVVLMAAWLIVRRIRRKNAE